MGGTLSVERTPVKLGPGVKNAGSFRVWAIGDKVLTAEGMIRYLLFYDYDTKELLPPLPEEGIPIGCRIFPSRNGYHFVGLGFYTAQEKREWWKLWASIIPSDYRLSNLNWLAPHSKEELDFILDQTVGCEILKCHYLRDKAVFEEWERLHG